MRFVICLLLAIAGALCAGLSPVSAQGCGPSNPGCIVPTAPAGTSDNRAASTAFVISALANASINAQTTAYAAQTSDCGKTITLDGAAFYALTVGAASGFSAGCVISVANTDTGRGKTMTINGVTFPNGGILYPLQSFLLVNVANAWQVAYPPGRYEITSPTTVYIDPANGSDTNDCLAATTGACATAAQAMVNIARHFIVNAALTMQFAAATYTNLPFNARQYIGTGTISLVGDTVTPSNVAFAISGSAVNCIFCFQVGGNWNLHGFSYSSSVGANNGNGVLVQGGLGQVTVGNLTMGALAGGFHLSCLYGGHLETDANNTVTGSAAVYIIGQDSSVCHDNGAGVTTISGSPTFSTALLQAHGGGGVVGVGASSISGAFSGTYCKADDGGIVDSAVIGSGGALISSASVCAGMTSINATSGMGQTYASLPTGVEGMLAHITDGLAANCGDSACTTFGTNVTGGGGALKLLVWRNGSNWTLIGK